MLYITFIFCLPGNKWDIWVPNHNCTLPFLPQMSLRWVVSCTMVHVGKVKRYKLLGLIPWLLFHVPGRLKMPVIPTMSYGLPVRPFVTAFFFLKTCFFFLLRCSLSMMSHPSWSLTSTLRCIAQRATRWSSPLNIFLLPMRTVMTWNWCLWFLENLSTGLWGKVESQWISSLREMSSQGLWPTNTLVSDSFVTSLREGMSVTWQSLNLTPHYGFQGSNNLTASMKRKQQQPVSRCSVSSASLEVFLISVIECSSE